MVSPVRGDYRRCQAEIPLIDLFKFAEPALLSRLGNNSRAGKLDSVISGTALAVGRSWLCCELLDLVFESAIDCSKAWFRARTTRFNQSRLRRTCERQRLINKQMVANASPSEVREHLVGRAEPEQFDKF
jgi:hypothetical protein